MKHRKRVEEAISRHEPERFNKVLKKIGVMIEEDLQDQRRPEKPNEIGSPLRAAALKKKRVAEERYQEGGPPGGGVNSGALDPQMEIQMDVIAMAAQRQRQAVWQTRGRVKSTSNHMPTKLSEPTVP